MNQLKFTVKGNRLELNNSIYSTGGSVNYDECEFTFDSEWNGFAKTAVFGIGRDTYKVGLKEDDTCFIPSPCMEKEGFISIGVYGTKDDTVIATNSVAHHIDEGIDGLGEWFEEDYSLVLNAVRNMQTKTQTCISDIKQNFEKLASSVRQSGSVTESSDNSCLPEEWYLPEEFPYIQDMRRIISGDSIDDYYDFGFNSLWEQYPNYIRRETVGYDTGNSYPIYSYVFEPLNYEKTVLVTSGIHGYDAGAYFALSKLFRDICEKSDSNRTLAYFRNRIRFVVIPLINPYAVINNKSYNVNDVDIGYNFPYCWEACTKPKKGSEAGDQTETQNIIEYLEFFQKDKLCAAVDIHMNPYTVSGKSIFYPRFKSTCLSALTDFVNSFNYEFSDGDKKKGILASNLNPCLSNYIADRYEINTCEAVFSDDVYGGYYNKDAYKKLTEFIGNLLCVMALNSSFTGKQAVAPFVKYISWVGSEGNYFEIPNSSSLTSMAISNYALSMSSPCILNLQGYVVIITSEKCTVKINPLLYQINSPEQAFNDRKSATSPFALEVELEAGTHVIPFSSVLQAYFTSYNASSRVLYSEIAKFRLTFSASKEATAKVTAYSATLCGIRSDAAAPVEISSPMGSVGDYVSADIPTQQIIYPVGRYTNYDSKFND